MTTMTTSVVRGLPHGRPLTYDDLALLTDDGHRYELIDGVLVVSPSPRLIHQRAACKLHILLAQGCPENLEVLMAPFDVKLAADTVVIPDLLVARMADLRELNLPTAPVLAVEVLSPSTRSFDLHLKKDRYRRAGTPHYWVVDPGLDSAMPSITVWHLRDGEYARTAHVEGSDVLSIELPFPVTVVPGELVVR